MKKYNWRDGIPIINWFPDRTVNQDQFTDLCRKADISINMGRMGILCTPWREHQADEIVVADLREFAVFSEHDGE